MTPEEAKEYFVMRLKDKYKYAKGHTTQREAFEKAVEALEKQIPKKPIDNGVKQCPNCGFVPFDTCTTITMDCEVTHIIHCEWCGQAIDYGE